MYPQRGGRRGRINMQLLTAPSVFSYTYMHVPPTSGLSWSCQYAIIDCLLLLFSLTLIYMYPQRGGRRGRINMQ